MYITIFRSIVPEAHCPNCNVLLSNRALRELFPEDKYTQVYIPRLAKAAFELEKQKLPFAMKYYKILKVIKLSESELEKSKDEAQTQLMRSQLEKKNALLALYKKFGQQINALKTLLESKDIPAHTLNIGNIQTFDIESAMQIIGTHDASNIGRALKGISISKFINEIVPANIAEMNEIATELGMTTDFVLHTIGANWYERAIRYAVAEYNGEDDVPKESSKSHFFYTYPCPKEDCNGFINLKYQCEVCGTSYCNKCLSALVPKQEHHCKKEDIESYEEIKRSTKPCPKCAARIYRSEGCAQMFCTKCHTGFDWNTGKIITTNFHNPHRMEWLQSIAHGVMDGEFNLCQGDTPREFAGCRVIQYYNSQANHVRDMVNNFRREFDGLNITRMTIQSLKTFIDYIAGKINDEKLLKRYKDICTRQKKLQQIIPVLEEFVDSMTATLNSLFQAIIMPPSSSEMQTFDSAMFATILEMVDAKTPIKLKHVLSGVKKRIGSRTGVLSIQDLCKEKYILEYKNKGIPFANHVKEVFERYADIINNILGHINCEIMMWSIMFHKPISSVYSYSTHSSRGIGFENITI